MSSPESRIPIQDASEHRRAQPESDASRAVSVDADWRWLYRIGGIAAALLVVITVLHTSVYFIVGLPTDVLGWFRLFEDNVIGGLLAFELLMVVYVVLNVPVLLAVYVALRRTSPSLMAIFAGLSLIAIISFIVSRPAFEMLALSNAYAAATDAQRSTYLAAGASTLAVFHGTAFWTSYVLGSVSGLVLSAVMLRSTVFSRATAYLRIASSILDFGLFVPGVGLFIALGSVTCLLGFNVLVALRLLQLGRGAPARWRHSRTQATRRVERLETSRALPPRSATCAREPGQPARSEANARQL